MNKKFYITTAIPYVNAAPHIGHALEFVQTDVIARYHRLIGDETYFLSGSDENSLKNVQAAEKLKIPVKKLCDENSKKFYEFKNILNISFDDFIRTTEKRHIDGVQKLWQKCQKDIYKKKYKGLYCVGCEVFYDEDELVEGKCPEHQTKPEEVSEQNYFFRLSKYQDWLKDLISTDKLKIIPEIRKNEVLSFIRRGLQDFSISRSVKRAHGWGIPVPDDPEQIIYVWFDALANYITALDYGNDEKLFKKYWPANVHVIGKGISRFHAIYWPAILKSAGIAIPKQEFIHGYVTVEGQKISKSLGNVIDPFGLVKKYDTDPIRYYLLREIPAYRDGDFSIQRFKEVYNADLANGLGNLVARIARLAQNYNLEFEKEFRKTSLSDEVANELEKFNFSGALELLWHAISGLDEYIDRKRPWESVSEGKKALWEIVVKGQAVSTIREIAYLLKPFLPETAEKIQKQFAGPKIKSGPPLFPRI